MAARPDLLRYKNSYIEEVEAASAFAMAKDSLTQLQSKDFDKQVLQSDLPTVVDFYADWCGPCRMVSPIIESLSHEYAGRVNFVKINTDESPELVERYGIMSIPTVMVFKKGQISSRTVGAGPAAMYRQRIEAALN